MPWFRKKPIAIEAILWDGSDDAYAAVCGLGGGAVIGRSADNITLSIPTLEGEMTASLGTWILKGVLGEVYPCQVDIFEATYEPVANG